MIGTVLFLLYTTAIAQTDLDDEDVDDFYDNGCPKDNSIEKLLPSEKCSQYFQCLHGELVPRLCPHGLHFNADLEKCDWNGHVDCHNKRNEHNSKATEELNKSNPTHATLICSAPDSKGVLVAHKNCNQFYKCLNGKPMAIKCAEGLLFNTITERCDSLANCGNRSPIDNGNHTNAKKDTESSKEEDDYKIIPICLSTFSNGVEVAHESCDKFYKCSGGVAVTQNCPINHFYNPIKEGCDWVQNVDCDGRTIPENINRSYGASIVRKFNYEEKKLTIGDDDEFGTADMICESNNSEGLLVSHEICNHFYKCLSNKLVAFYCPGDLLFNDEKNYCDWPSNVRCGDRIVSNDIDRKNNVVDPKQAFTICSDVDSDGILIAHRFCNKFYKCFDGVPVEVKCPGILLYNLNTKNCDWPTYVHCKDRIVPENGWSRKEDDESDEESSSEIVDENNPVTGSDYGYEKITHSQSKRNNLKINGFYSTAFDICAAANFDGRTLPHENCNQYYKCIEGESRSLFCDLGFFYQSEKGYCDWANLVNCTGREVPRNNNNNNYSTYADGLCNGHIDGYVGPTEICSQFYKCVNNRSYIMYCPLGLYYNAKRKVCDWLENVHCGNRMK